MDNESDDRTYNRLRRLLISSRDFGIANSATLFLLGEVDETAKYDLEHLRRFRCYETTMVVAYARPFSMTRGDVHPLRKVDVGLSNRHRFSRMHDRLMSYRNTIFGHSDAEHIGMAVWSITPFEDRPDLTMTMPRFDEGMVFTLDEVELIGDTVREFMATIMRSVNELSPRFQDKFLHLED